MQNLHAIRIILFRDAMNTMQEFPRYVDTSENMQRAEIRRIQTFVTQELTRQNALANATKTACEAKLTQLQSRVEAVSDSTIQ